MKTLSLQVLQVKALEAQHGGMPKLAWKGVLASPGATVRVTGDSLHQEWKGETLKLWPLVSCLDDCPLPLGFWNHFPGSSNQKSCLATKSDK
jgi:hypothetical protein